MQIEHFTPSVEGLSPSTQAMLLNQKPYEDFKKAESGDGCSSGIEIVMMRGTSSKSHKKSASESLGSSVENIPKMSKFMR